MAAGTPEIARARRYWNVQTRTFVNLIKSFLGMGLLGGFTRTPAMKSSAVLKLDLPLDPQRTRMHSASSASRSHSWARFCAPSQSGLSNDIKLKSKRAHPINNTAGTPCGFCYTRTTSLSDEATLRSGHCLSWQLRHWGLQTGVRSRVGASGLRCRQSSYQ